MTDPQSFTDPGSTGFLPALCWTDGVGRPWTIELRPDAIVLQDETGQSFDFPRARWAQDLLLSRYGDEVAVRFESFAGGANFVVPAEQAQPLLAHLGLRPTPGARVIDDVIASGPAAAGPLLWPKVSPLAVWALICSALVFVPILGLLPALATIILLTLHRRRVRRTRAYSHSRALCAVAAGFLACGLIASAVATAAIARNATAVWDRFRQADSPYHTAPALEAVESPDRAQSMPLPLAQGFWSREHNWGLIVAGLVVLLMSLSVHETAHAITAWWLGDDFARRLGRVTLNPLAHIDPFGTVILPLMLFMVNPNWVFGFAKPVPVRTDYVPRPRRAQILISLAGPGSNLLLAAGSYLLLLTLGSVVSLALPDAEVSNFVVPAFAEPVRATGFAGAWLFSGVCTVLNLSFFLNVILAFFNLIPIPPLDGSWVLEHLFPNTLGRVYARIRPYAIIIFIMFMYSRLSDYFLYPAFAVLLPAMGLLQFATGF